MLSTSKLALKLGKQERVLRLVSLRCEQLRYFSRSDEFSGKKPIDTKYYDRCVENVNSQAKRSTIRRKESSRKHERSEKEEEDSSPKPQNPKTPRPSNPVRPTIPATQPDAIPITDRMRSIRWRFICIAIGSKTCLVLSESPGPWLVPGWPDKSAIGSAIMVTKF